MEKLENLNLFQRNQPFISVSAQKVLSKIKVALIGVGLSSQVAQALVRLGVANLSLWDEDIVCDSNLNRQAFTAENIGENKASVTAEELLRINPHIKLEVHSRHFTHADIDVLFDYDIVINSVDFENSLVYDISDQMQKQSAWCIQPFNLGMGGSCMLFGANTPSLSDITSGRQSEPGAFVMNLINSCTGFNPSDELMHQSEQILSVSEEKGYFPQNIIATLLTTSLISWTIVKIAEGSTMGITAPRLLHFEPKMV